MKRALATLTALTAAALAVAAPEASATPPIPTRMVALGDSLSRGVNACTAGQFCGWKSWSTGSDPAVRSHWSRIHELNPDVIAYNDAKAGAGVAHLAGTQVRTALAHGGIDYVTIMIGTRDACAPTEAGMTSVGDFEGRFRTAMKALHAGAPEASVFVASIPDLKQVWELGKDNEAARKAWADAPLCGSMFANPASRAPQDEARRDRVRDRIMDYNAALDKVCAEFAGTCRYDGDAVFDHRFTAADISTTDFFHPSAAGQRTLADVTYEAGFDW
ncbi:GDSL-type esterase/lipase family protein [Streptomyces sp. NPDC049577]|uniref:GDSL-type esterase/lipase family protein n=1 Tax=Streptomyces sp. NPDC049577 TaxID=3155153 RepID=UPI003444DAAB